MAVLITAHVPLVRPNGTVRTTVRFAVTGINSINGIYITVIVTVILPKIQTVRVRFVAGVPDHLIGMRVFTVFVVLTVIGSFLTEFHRSEDIKNGGILSVTLVLEIFPRATIGIDMHISGPSARESRFLNVTAGEIGAVQQAVNRIFGCGKFRVCEIYEQH